MAALRYLISSSPALTVLTPIKTVAAIAVENIDQDFIIDLAPLLII